MRDEFVKKVFAERLEEMQKKQNELENTAALSDKEEKKDE
jgi:hypothetical protein